MSITWNTGSAAERFRHNLKLKKNKKKKKASSAKPQAPSAMKKPQIIFKTILEFEKDKS